MRMQKLAAGFVAAVSLVLFGLPVLAGAASEAYSIDKDHSFANWNIRHVAARVSGTFYDLSGKIMIDPDDLKSIKVEATINVLSISTGNRERDSHLLSSDFFDALKFRDIRFVSTAVEAKGKDEGILQGELTLHGVTRTVQMPFRVLGFGADPWGGYRAGFEAKTQLKRSEYGINWGLNLPGGGAVGDEVEITLFIEGVKLGPDGMPLKIK